MPQKSLPLTKIGINCVLDAIFMHFSKKYRILAAILNISLGATFYFWEDSGCLLGSYKEPKKVGLDWSWGCKGTPISSPTVCILAVAKMIISTIFSVVNALKYHFNAFYGKKMFWLPFWWPSWIWSIGTSWFKCIWYSQYPRSPSLWLKLGWIVF